MAVTQLSDIVKPENYGRYNNEMSVELNNLWQSGVIVTSPELQALANSGGTTINVPFWTDLAKTEPNMSSDDPSTDATPLKNAANKMVARISHMNQAWGSSDLATEIAGSDPLASVNQRLETYWAEQFQRRLTATIKGVVADSVANHSGDLVFTQGGATPAVFDAKGVSSAAQTMGDFKGKLRAIVVHSQVQKLMADSGLIDYLRDETSNIIIPTFRGLQVVMDDEVEVDTSGAKDVYSSYLIGGAAFGMAAGTPKNALEGERKALAGNGGGIEYLVSRKTPIVHPLGYQWVEGTIAGDSPTRAELEDAAHWTRVLTSRKQIPFAVYKCTIE